MYMHTFLPSQYLFLQVCLERRHIMVTLRLKHKLKLDLSSVSNQIFHFSLLEFSFFPFGFVDCFNWICHFSHLEFSLFSFGFFTLLFWIFYFSLMDLSSVLIDFSLFSFGFFSFGFFTSFFWICRQF